jgi:hypothetical protein
MPPDNAVMAESDAPVRCPRGHLTAAGYQFCTTCGERVAPEPDVSGPVMPPPLLDSDDGIGFALPPDLGPQPATGEGLAGGSKRGRLRGGIGRLGRKPKESEAPVGPSLLVTDVDVPGAERVENEPPTIDPPEVEPPQAGRSAPPTVYGDVEFAIGPGTKSVVTYGPEPVVPSPEAATRSRIPGGIPTRLLVAILVLVAGIAAAIVLFVIREPGTPAAELSTVPPAQPSVVASPAPSVAPAAVVSEECGNSFAFAAAHAAEAQAPVLQQSTLTFCGTSDEWLAAARLNPTAIGLTDASEVGDDDLARVCAGAPGTGLCSSTLTPPTGATASPAVGPDATTSPAVAPDANASPAVASPPSP